MESLNNKVLRIYHDKRIVDKYFETYKLIICYLLLFFYSYIFSR